MSGYSLGSSFRWDANREFHETRNKEAEGTKEGVPPKIHDCIYPNVFFAIPLLASNFGVGILRVPAFSL